MRNIFKKSLFITLACLATSTIWAQSTKTFDFSNESALNDWTFTVDNPKNGTAKYEILSSHQGIAAKDGSFLALSYMNQSLIKITLTSKESFNNISHISYDVCSTDNSKPDFTLNIVDDDGNIIQNIYSNYTTKGNFGSSGTKVWGKSDSNIEPAKTGHVQIVTYASSSGKYAAIDNIIVTYQAGKSTDATLSDLKIDGTTIEGFDPNKTAYTYSVPATATAAPVITATKNDSKAADPVITQPALPTPGNSTTGTVKVTAEDQTTTLTYTITFTRAELSHDATLKDIQVDDKSISGFSPTTLSYNVDIPFSQTTIPVVTATVNNNEAKAVVTQATAIEGTATIVVTAEDNTTTQTYTLNFHKKAASNVATLQSLSYDGKPIVGFSSSVLDYTVELEKGSTVPTVSAVATHEGATIAYEQAKTINNGVAKVNVTAEDKTTKKTYTVTFKESTGPLPHMPGVYETKYKATITEYNKREYETYYFSYKSSKVYLGVGGSYGSNDKTPLVPGIDGVSAGNLTSTDGWLNITATNYSGSNTSPAEEFAVGSNSGASTHYAALTKSTQLSIRVKGYDQFSFGGRDAGSKAGEGKQFVVKINDKDQTFTHNTTDWTIFRFDLDPEETYTIVVTGDGTDENRLRAFSLRLPPCAGPQITTQPSPDNVTYKLNATVTPLTIETETSNVTYQWYKSEYKDYYGATPISGATNASYTPSSAQLDTLYYYCEVSFTEGCPTVTKSELSGAIAIAQPSIKAIDETTITVYQSDPLTIRFQCLALDENEIDLTWAGNTPKGITTSLKNDVFTIQGASSDVGQFPFTVSAANLTPITGKITIEARDLTNHPILYLYKGEVSSLTNDYIFSYLKNDKKLNMQAYKTDTALRSDLYDVFDWILISPTADATNPEILDIIRGKANKPVLNMNGFTYNADRLGWGEASNGTQDTTKNNDGCNIFIQRADHPIFKTAFATKKQGDAIKILNEKDKKGLTPINVNNCNGSLCLATAYTRDINDYFKDGEQQTILHEIPASKANGPKYICFSVGTTKDNLTNDGKKLLSSIVDYLTSTESSVKVPNLGITSFKTHGITATIKDYDITLELTQEQYEEYNHLQSETPEIELINSSLTHVVPGTDKPWDLSLSYIEPFTIVVTDYINRVAYSFKLTLTRPEGIEDIYTVGQWVNIFDIYGRKITTTNEDIYTMDLPRGIYIVVTENGNTIKITR